MAAAIVDGGGNLVYFEKMDNTQIGSVNVAIEKARSAALFKRPTKAFEDALASGGGGLRVLGVPGVFPLRGWYSAAHRRQHCRCHRDFGRDFPAGRPVRQGSHGRLKIVGRSAVPARLPDFVEPTKAKVVDSMRPAIGSTKSSLTVTAP